MSLLDGLVTVEYDTDANDNVRGVTVTNGSAWPVRLTVARASDGRVAGSRDFAPGVESLSLPGNRRFNHRTLPDWSLDVEILRG